MSSLYKQNQKKDAQIQYRPTRRGKISLSISIVSLAISILTLLLNIFSILPGYSIVIVIVGTVISVSACIFVLIDRVQFNKTNNVKVINENDMNGVIYLLFGIIIALIFAKLIL